MNSVDTNVLFYAHDSRVPNKQRIRAELIASGIHMRKRSGTSNICAAPGAPFFRAGQLWTGLRDNYSLSFWNALLIATCLEAGVEQLFSEDFSSYRLVDTLRIVNPF